ncbi:discoidin domain-containing protein [Pedobacter agri]|uniref:discoidin domain-containing protein n=1 Tax=Pedobacter agri TaxID=454586 RepID=UPI0029306F16|nr:discoidin domain-containing protein [Pedobacter agri]
MIEKIFKLSNYVVLIVIALSACKKIETPYSLQTESKSGAKVYIARSTGNIQNLTIFPYQDEARTFEFNASFGALGLPSKAINVKLAIDDKAFDSLNVVRVAQGLTPYQKFPVDAFSLNTLSATIMAGQLNSELVKLSYFPKKFSDKIDYVLPISITSADGYPIGGNKTIFIVAPKLTEVQAVKTGWVAASSSQELVGEGSGNGKADFAIDGNNTTYWHSKWQSPAPVFPHWLSVDMKNEIFVTKVELIPRQNNNNGFTLFNLEASKDGNTWTTLGTNLPFDPSIKTGQSYTITPAYWRYIKVTATQSASASITSTHLAEINVYKY